MISERRRNFRRWQQLVAGAALVQVGAYTHLSDHPTFVVLFAGFLLIVTADVNLTIYRRTK